MTALDYSLLAQVLVNGIIAGGILALISIGYNLIYGILRFINFAHGEVVITSSFLLFLLFSKLSFPLPLAIIISILFTIIIGLLINQIAYKPLRNAPPLSLLVAAVSMSLILQALLLIFFTADVQIVKNPFPTDPIEIFGATVTPVQLAIIFLSIFFVITTELFLSKTKIGKEMRATADNPELAKTVGIDIERTIAFTFALASSLAAIAGIMIAFEHPINFLLGVNIGLRAFAASVVGGIGSVTGSFIGGYLLGIAENVGILFIPSGYKDAIGFFILILFLLFKPNGILNTNVRRV